MSITKNLIKEEILPWFGFYGHVHLYEGKSTDHAPSKTPPTNIIQTDQFWYVVFHWETEGGLNHIMCGDWVCRVVLEQMGKGEFGGDEDFIIDTVPFKSYPTKDKADYYESKIQVAPHKVPAGVYRVVATLTLKGKKGVPAPVAAFADLGLVQFYQEAL
jgi:hypothetical protein